MNKLKQSLTYFALILTILTSCSETIEIPKGEFAEGVIVINEGNFSDANGSVSFYNEGSEETTQDIIAQANGITTGGLLQSVYFHDDLAFIIDNSGAKIHMVNAATFELITTIEDGLSSPRYMTVLGDKAYVTNWGAYDENWDLPNSYVSVIDLETLEQTSAISTDKGCEGLFVFADKVYVANSFSNTIDVIDPGSESVTSQFEVAAAPVSFVEDKNGKVWVLSSNYLGAALSQVELASEEVLKSFTIGSSARSLSINGSGDQLYYLSAPYGEEASVFSVSIEAREDNTTALISESNLYGLGVHPQTGEIFLGNHNGFQGNGTVLIYEGTALKSSFATGVAPNGFVFR